MHAILRSLIVAIGLGLFAAICSHAAASVVLVSSERSPAYIEAVEALVGELERAGLLRSDVLQLMASEVASVGALAPKIYVALGSEAADVLAKTEQKVPVLCILLPRSSFERVLQGNGRKTSAQFSAIFLDQPIARQLDFIHLALPAVQQVGVLWGPESQSQAAAMKILAQASGLEVVDATVGRDQLAFSSLKQVLEKSDVLLAVADPQVYNSSSIQNILLASFRAKVPMVAFSPAYVRAGALLALYVTPSQVGQQAAVIARGVLQGKALSATPLYSQDFSISVNEHVARSLGLSLDAESLRTRLRRREGAP
jgi:putative ABC transport system substrate-binding protein